MLLGKILLIIGCSLTVGLFFAIILIGGFPEKDDYKKKIKCIIISLLIGCACYGMIAFECEKEIKEWNNGVCPNCQVKWRYTNTQHIKNEGDVKYYVCDHCGKVISQKD